MKMGDDEIEPGESILLNACQIEEFAGRTRLSSDHCRRKFEKTQQGHDTGLTMIDSQRINH